jgi:inner membrane protein
MRARRHAWLAGAGSLATVLGLELGGMLEGGLLPYGGLCVCAAVWGSLAPDADWKEGTINGVLGPAGRSMGALIQRTVGHRGLTHSLVFWLCWLAPALLWTPWGLGWWFAAGYASHIISDALTEDGVELFAPMSSRRVRLGPGRRG